MTATSTVTKAGTTVPITNAPTACSAGHSVFVQNAARIPPAATSCTPSQSHTAARIGCRKAHTAAVFSWIPPQLFVHAAVSRPTASVIAATIPISGSIAVIVVIAAGSAAAAHA